MCKSNNWIIEPLTKLKTKHCADAFPFPYNNKTTCKAVYIYMNEPSTGRWRRIPSDERCPRKEMSLCSCGRVLKNKYNNFNTLVNKEKECPTWAKKNGIRRIPIFLSPCWRLGCK